MAPKILNVTIAGSQYRITKLPFVEGQAGLLRLGKIVAPSLGEMGRSVGKVKVSKATIVDALAKGIEVDFGAIGDGFGALLGQLTEEDLTWFVDAFSRQTEVQPSGGKWAPLHTVIDAVFAGDWQAYREWLAACVRHNYASFFGGLLVAAGAPQAEAKA